MTLKELKNHVPGWVRVQSPLESESSIYYLEGNVRVGAYGTDPWVSATSAFRVTFRGERFIYERIPKRADAVIVHIYDIEDKVTKFNPDTSFGKLVINDIFRIRNPHKYHA